MMFVTMGLKGWRFVPINKCAAVTIKYYQDQTVDWKVDVTSSYYNIINLYYFTVHSS